MIVTDTSTKREYNIEILPVDEGDYETFDEDRYHFDWKTEKKFEVYKLRINGSNEVLGLISFENIPEEWRIHIRLLTVSKENVGSNKQYDRIAGNLITYVAKKAVADYAELACVSLRPKSEIAQHYIDNYNMRVTGMTLSIEVPEILDLINFYDHD